MFVNWTHDTDDILGSIVLYDFEHTVSTYKKVYSVIIPILF